LESSVVLPYRRDNGGLLNIFPDLIGKLKNFIRQENHILKYKLVPMRTNKAVNFNQKGDITCAGSGII